MVDPSCEVSPSLYHCLDVDLEALKVGHDRFPESGWHHYDRWHRVYNRSGSREARIPLERGFDAIVAFSVFSHSTLEEMDHQIGELRELRSPGCRMFLTFLEPAYSLHYFIRKRIIENPDISLDPSVLASMISRDWFYYWNYDGMGEDPPEGCQYFVSFYSASFLSDRYGADVHHPTGTEIHSCMIIE